MSTTPEHGPLPGAVRGLQSRVVELALTLVLAVAAGCAGGAAEDPDHVFAAIQVHEATLAHEAADAARCEPDAACPAIQRACIAAEAVCNEASRIDDRDADTRCEAGRAQCRALGR
ncbi:MAG: hypothetical protein AB7S26_08940 [Sandaracinaceae bacterium]